MERPPGSARDDDAPGAGLNVPDLVCLGAGAAMLGLFGSMVAVEVRGALAEARVTRAREDLRSLGRSLAAHREVKGRFPASLEAMAHDPCYGPAEPVPDPWGRRYGYAMGPGNRAVVRSLGADGVPGGKGEDADHEVVIAAPPPVRR